MRGNKPASPASKAEANVKAANETQELVNCLKNSVRSSPVPQIYIPPPSLKNTKGEEIKKEKKDERCAVFFLLVLKFGFEVA